MWERGEAVWNEICHIFFQIDATEPFGGYLNLVLVFILRGLLAVGAKSTDVSISLLWNKKLVYLNTYCIQTYAGGKKDPFLHAFYPDILLSLLDM